MTREPFLTFCFQIDGTRSIEKIDKTFKANFLVKYISGYLEYADNYR